MEYMEVSSQRKIKHIVGPGKWKQPSESTLKLNSDAMLTQGDTQTACEVVNRDHEGNVVAVKASKSGGVHDASTAELSSEYYHHGRSVSRAGGVVFKMDSQLLAHTLNRRKPEFSHMVVAVDAIKIHLGSWFSTSNAQACR